jgi:hypothetical protein
VTARYHGLIDAYPAIPPANELYRGVPRERWEQGQAEAEREETIARLEAGTQHALVAVADDGRRLDRLEAEVARLRTAVARLSQTVEALAVMVRRNGGAA